MTLSEIGATIGAQVTVVIPVYNRSHVLESAIKSCVEQSIVPMEIIVVDDYSAPEEKLKSRKIVDRFPLARFIENKGVKGAQSARNTGAKAAQGEWISFLDSDDYFLSESIEKRLDAARRTGARVVHSECIVIRDKDFQRFGIPPMEGKIYRDLLQRPGPIFQGMLVHKEALEEVGYLDESIISYQEWDSSIRLARCFEFAFVAEPTFVYDCRGTDTISKDMLRDARGYRQIVRKYTREIVANLGPRAMANHCAFIASRYQAAGDYREASKFRVLSIIWWPFRVGAALSNRAKSAYKRLLQ